MIDSDNEVNTENKPTCKQNESKKNHQMRKNRRKSLG